MDHIAIDLGASESHVCVRSSDGKILDERRWDTATLNAFLEQRPPSRVVIETGAESFRVADAAMIAGHEVRVVPATLVKTLGVGSRRMKNDRRDAQILSEVSCRIDLPSVHIPSRRSRQRRAQAGMRSSLVRSRTRLINSVRGWMRTEHLRVGPGSTASFPKRVRQFYESKRATPIPEFVQRQLQAIEALTDGIHEADVEIRGIAKSDETCRRLMTVPGVGHLTALQFVATVDVVGRFASSHFLESYLGLTPGEHSSSERQRTTSITKAGSCSLRWVLVEAAWNAVRRASRDPMVEWARRLAQRRGWKIAIIALARKMAGILYAIWRDGTEYDATRGGCAVDETTRAEEV